MGSELDPLDDIFDEDTAKNGRVGGKFQPKAKQKPSRKDSAATSVSSSRPVPTSDAVEHKSSVILRTDKPSEHCFHRYDQSNSISVTLSSQNIVTIDRPNTTAGLVSDSDVFMPDGNCSWQSNFDKSGENRDILLGLESLDDFLPYATADMETIAEGSIPSEAASADVPSTKNAGLPIPVHSSIDASTCPQQSAVQDPLTGGEPVISISYDGDHMDNRVVETEEMDIMDAQVLSDLTTSFGRCSRKFQPKPKIQMQNKMHEASTINADGSESASCLQDSQSIPSEINFGDKCSNSAFSQDDVLDLSAVGFTHAIPSESMPELIVDEDPINLMETYQLNSGFLGDHPEFDPKMPAELSLARTRKSKTRTSIPSPEQQNPSTSGQENEAGRSLRPRGNKNLFQLVDEFDDEFHVDGEFPAECPSSSVVGEDNISDKKFQVENESQTKKVKRNSVVKPIGDKGKPAGKQQKAKETLDQAAKSKPKKFSHSTLKRRRVDKVLLETPEDEIDFQKVPLRDLILLAEHKEQLQKKEATTGVPSTNQSKSNPSENYNEDEPFASEQDGEYDHEQESHRVKESNVYFNYQTYMDRTPRVRWSKQDTELFYEAIQQFGTDLSMIQQLFPGRTRNQVKLKYKKEERQHPMRLREALTIRAKDHSHFEKVIEHLQQIAAEENQNSNKDDSIDLTGDEDAEGSHGANGEELKTEREGGENEYTAEEFTEIQSPVKSCDSEDDLSRSEGYSNSQKQAAEMQIPIPPRWNLPYFSKKQREVIQLQQRQAHNIKFPQHTTSPDNPMDKFFQVNRVRGKGNVFLKQFYIVK